MSLVSQPIEGRRGKKRGRPGGLQNPLKTYGHLRKMGGIERIVA